jgi:hypothetical protein
LALNPANAKNSFSPSLEADFGLPGLKLDVKGQAKVDLDYDFGFTFGVSKDNGEFFVDTSSDTFNLGLKTSSIQFNGAGELGFIEVNLDDRGTSFNGAFGIDLKDSNDLDTKLTLSELTSFSLDSKLTANAMLILL